MMVCSVCGQEIKANDSQYRTVTFHFKGIEGRVVKTFVYCKECYEAGPMEQREKLIELILKCNKDNDLFDCFPDRPRYRQAAEILADHLIANGVVVLPCRCGECEHGRPDIFNDGYIVCGHKGVFMKQNDFCSGARQKGGDE